MRLLFGLFSGAKRMVANSDAGAYAGRVIEQLTNEPEKTQALIDLLTYRAWYINLDQIQDWAMRIRKIPETFVINNNSQCLYREIRNKNELLMVVKCNATDMGITLGGNVSTVNVTYSFVFYVRPNEKTGYYEMRTFSYNDTMEKNLMSAFGRKFFDALKAL